jgi:hypothetical protein
MSLENRSYHSFKTIDELIEHYKKGVYLSIELAEKTRDPKREPNSERNKQSRAFYDGDGSRLATVVQDLNQLKHNIIKHATPKPE